MEDQKIIDTGNEAKIVENREEIVLSESAGHSKEHKEHSDEKHHHHHHHNHHKHKSRRNKKKLNPLIPILAGFCIFLLLIIVVERQGWLSAIDDKPQYNAGTGTLKIELINERAVLVNEAVREYLDLDMLDAQNKLVTPGRFLTDGKLDAQVSVGLKFSLEEANALYYKIEISTDSAFENAVTEYVENLYGTYQMEHLYTNTDYYYRVTAFTSDGSISESGRFKTADTPRILSVDGISNVRDIGNWKTDNGKRIKQGLLLRGTELDGAVESVYHLTNKGLVDMLMTFGIKTDMDLRGKSTLYKDALGSQVEHNYYSMVMYAGIFNEAGKAVVREVFSDLAEPENYPIYLHCTYGRDRTGTICYLLEALLGVSRGDCLKEYGLSDMPLENILSVEQGLQAYEGNSLKEQVEAYLISCGINATQIQSIREIFLGE